MEKQKNIPELRFPGFDGGWKIERTGNYINLISGYAFKGDEISEDSSGTPILRGINITEGHIRHNSDIDRYFHGDVSLLKKYILKKGDIVLGMDGSKVGKNVALISELDENSILIQRVARINSNKESDIKFIFQRIFSPIFHKYVDVVNTSSGIPHISLQQIKDFTVGYPSLPEQQEIASFFTAIDQKISQLKQKKTLLEQYKKGVMQKIFSQEIRFKDEKGQKFPKWEKNRLGEIANFFKGKGISKSEVSNDGTTECIRYGELYTYYNETIDRVKSKTNVHSKELVFSQSNDIIIPASGETQIDIATASCVLRSGVALGGDLNIIRTENNGVFLSYYLNNYKKKDIANLAQGISVVHLYSSQLSLLEVEIPSLAEQSKIAIFISSIDIKINHTQTQIENAKRWKKGLLQKMFV